jgi:hydroxyacylglutathione hydrolase
MNITPIPAFSDNYIWMIFHEGRAAVVDPGDPAPVLTALEDQALSLDTIIITHHHFDHTGGVAALKSATGCRVIGPDNPKIGDIDYTMVEGAQVTVLGHGFEVMEVPGHTLDHIAYYSAENRTLFCGDTLFVGGCGRVFEGTFPMMQQSLAKLRDLPSETKVYCTHEYTMANLTFARKVEPLNADLLAHIETCEQRRDSDLPTVPSTIGQELLINPFLRWNSPAIIAQLKHEGRHTGDSAADVFGAVRGWKDEG